MIQFLLVFMTMLMATPMAGASAAGDSVMIHYYLGKLDSVLNNWYLFEKGGDFSFSLFSNHRSTNYRGELQKSDTAEFTVFFRDKNPDSVHESRKGTEERNRPPADYKIRRWWQDNCRFYLFPNDTGSGDLAIGFDPVGKNAGERPSGFLTLDRDSYFLKSLSLNFAKRKGYIRYSEAIQFGRDGAWLIPERMIIDGSHSSFFAIKYFKQILEFRDYEIQ